MKEKDVITNGRFGGLVERFHTWPRIQHQNTGEHSWQAMRIYYMIWGPLPPQVSTYFIWHDAGEVRAGDIPYHTKKSDPHVEAVLESIEADTVQGMGGPSNIYGELTSTELTRCKFCDMMDIVEWSIVELAFGNRFALAMFENAYESISKQLEHITIADGHRASVYLRKVLLTANAYGVILPGVTLTSALEAAQ